MQRWEENRLERAEIRNERAAERAMERGDIGAAMMYEGRAERLDNQRNRMEVRAEQRAENRAMNDLARGDIRGYEREMNKANRIENRRENQNFVADINDGVGMRGAFQPAAPYVAPPYVAPVIAENRMMNAEIREEQIAAYDNATGNYIGAAIHNERARELDAARNNMEIQQERRAENRAMNDLMHGNIGGFIANEARANQIENRRENENYIANQAYIGNQPNYVQPPPYVEQPAYVQPGYNQPAYAQPAYVRPQPGYVQPPVIQPVIPQPVISQRPIIYEERDACACNLL